MDAHTSTPSHFSPFIVSHFIQAATQSAILHNWRSRAMRRKFSTSCRFPELFYRSPPVILPQRAQKRPDSDPTRRLLAHGSRDMAVIHALSRHPGGSCSMWQVSPDVFNNVRFGIPSINQPTNGKRTSMFFAFPGPDTKKPDFFDPSKLHLKSWALRTPWARPAERFARAEIAAAKSQLESARFADGSLTPSCFDSTPGTKHIPINGSIFSTWWLIPLSKWVITTVINGISRVNPLKSLGL